MGESNITLRKHYQCVLNSLLCTSYITVNYLVKTAYKCSPWTSFVVFFECLLLVVFCKGQGRLVDPPSRASMWRFGFKNPVEFGDDRVDCGGFMRQWRENQGRCGVCGDPWDLPRPRPHETRGMYGRGTIVRNYTQGQVVEWVSELTDGGSGWMEYRVCPRANVWRTEDPSCFNHTLQDNNGRTQLPVNVTAKLSRITHTFRLPPHLSCLACVVQWRYVRIGRPNRADYRACADVIITPTNTSHTTPPPPSLDNSAAASRNLAATASTTTPTGRETETTNTPTPQTTDKNACAHSQMSPETKCSTSWTPPPPPTTVASHVNKGIDADGGDQYGGGGGGGGVLSGRLGSVVVLVSMFMNVVIV
ncbi:uncharacterized protein LOC121865272 [Homarus americanus]|uniref:uncharacterized protein LOC121865272 n=1 Tax=Homarus americanus TaxID=6706 RepID=UPI001C484E29|nr:uncharacterized protein LOC121865272 [Homarus americanus]